MEEGLRIRGQQEIVEGADELGTTLVQGAVRLVLQVAHSMGQVHEACPVDRFVVDRERKIITTPAYMLARDIAEAATGIERTIDALLGMLPTPKR